MKKNISPKVWVISAGFVATALVVVGTAWWLTSKDETKPTAMSTSQASVDAAPKDEIKKEVGGKEVNKGGSQSDRPQTPAPANSGSKATVYPIVTGFGKSEDGSYLLVDGGVNGIVEVGGVCRFIVLWQGGEVSQQTEGGNSPSSINCKTAQFSLKELPSNTNLTMKLEYTSQRYQGASNNNPSVEKGQIQ